MILALPALAVKVLPVVVIVLIVSDIIYGDENTLPLSSLRLKNLPVPSYVTLLLPGDEYPNPTPAFPLF